MYNIIFNIYKFTNTLLFKIVNFVINFPYGFICGDGVVYYFGGVICNRTGERGNLIIGDNCQIGGELCVYGDGRLEIGESSYINIRSKIVVINKVLIGSYCIIAQDVHIEDNNNHPISWRIRKEDCKNVSVSNKFVVSKPIIVEDCVWIGRRAIILKGVTIGKGSIVGAGAVVTKDVPPFSIVAGNPARIVKKID